MMNDDIREPFIDAAESENPGMCGNSMRENRETPQTPSPVGGGGRSEKAAGHTADAYVCGESDDSVVPAKRANKAEPQTTRPRYCDTRRRKGETTVNTNIDLNQSGNAAESVEERGSTKGNVFQLTAYRTQSRKGVSIELEGVRRAAIRGSPSDPR